MQAPRGPGGWGARRGELSLSVILAMVVIIIVNLCTESITQVDQTNLDYLVFPGYIAALLVSDYCSSFLAVTYTAKVSFDSSRLTRFSTNAELSKDSNKRTVRKSIILHMAKSL